MEAKLSIAFLICATIVTIASIISSSISKILLKRYEDYFEHTKKFNDALFEYCITDIMNRSIQREDYETAGKCMELLKSIKEQSS